jgi:hypothetical protein
MVIVCHHASAASSTHPNELWLPRMCWRHNCMCLSAGCTCVICSLQSSLTVVTIIFCQNRGYSAADQLHACFWALITKHWQGYTCIEREHACIDSYVQTKLQLVVVLGQ